MNFASTRIFAGMLLNVIGLFIFSEFNSIKISSSVDIANENFFVYLNRIFNLKNAGMISKFDDDI